MKGDNKMRCSNIVSYVKYCLVLARYKKIYFNFKKIFLVKNKNCIYGILCDQIAEMIDLDFLPKRPKSTFNEIFTLKFKEEDVILSFKQRTIMIIKYSIKIRPTYSTYTIDRWIDR